MVGLFCMDAEQLLTRWINLAERKTEILEALKPQVLDCLDGSAHRILSSQARNKKIDPRTLLEILDSINEQLQSVQFCNGNPCKFDTPDDFDIAKSVINVHQTIVTGLSQLETICESELRIKLEQAFETLDTSYSSGTTQRLPQTTTTGQSPTSFQ
jgi:hypothetical protein